MSTPSTTTALAPPASRPRAESSGGPGQHGVPCRRGGSPMISVDTCRLFRAEFPALADRASAVRRMVTGHLREWRLDALVDCAVLATNELFANAVEHGSSGPADTVSITVSLEGRGHELRVEVADGSPVVPRFHEAAPTAESGRGLAIVDGLASDWGTEPPDPGSVGKRVWFTLPVEPVESLS
ncbi:ATP-binding protein [Streptomyces sp. NPDC048636]|uniref:ATP-binding protein n=1 Tax=Streptomyces sp. NPDC048636 TaxID=3155762 RepID=UPI00342A2184